MIPRVAVVATGFCLLLLLFFQALYLLSSDDVFRQSIPKWPFSKTIGKSLEIGDDYLLGVGKADITGPVVEINLMGYADPNQIGSGVRQRLYSRAFIVGELARPENRFVYIVIDTQSGDTAIRDGILKAIAELGPELSKVLGISLYIPELSVKIVFNISGDSKIQYLALLLTFCFSILGYGRSDAQAPRSDRPRQLRIAAVSLRQLYAGKRHRLT